MSRKKAPRAPVINADGLTDLLNVAHAAGFKTGPDDIEVGVDIMNGTITIDAEKFKALCQPGPTRDPSTLTSPSGPDREKIRFVTVRSVKYLRQEDIAHLIREVAGTEDTDVRNRLEALAREVSK